MSTIEATPVPVQPPQVPPRPALLTVAWPVFADSRCIGWGQMGYEEDRDAQEFASRHPGSVIFRLPGSGEVQA